MPQNKEKERNRTLAINFYRPNLKTCSHFNQFRLHSLYNLSTLCTTENWL